MQNLRDDIYENHRRISIPSLSDERRKVIEEVALKYLRRYFYLLCFTAYVMEQRHDESAFAERFEQWMNEHRELYSLLNNYMTLS
jgi:hypothetical protein